MIETFKTKAFVETHCKLIIPISSHGKKILHLLWGLYVGHVSELWLLLYIVVEISWHKNAGTNVLAQTDF